MKHQQVTVVYQLKFFYQAAVIDGLLVPSDKATSLCVKVRDMTYCCGPYDPGLNQAKREKVYAECNARSSMKRRLEV